MSRETVAQEARAYVRRETRTDLEHPERSLPYRGFCLRHGRVDFAEGRFGTNGRNSHRIQTTPRVRTTGSHAQRFSTVEQAIQAVAWGLPVIVLDPADRENEGDFIVAAEKVTPEMVHFLITHARGLLCMSVLPDTGRRLQLTPMVGQGTNGTDTPFAVPLDHRRCSTGISPADRALTIRAIVDPSSLAEDFERPGHLFPLIAQPGGVLCRVGHTEAAVDLVRLAGLRPAGVLCEICSQDGMHMAKLDELFQIASDHRLPIITIEALIDYRRRTEGHRRSHLGGQRIDSGSPSVVPRGNHLPTELREATTDPEALEREGRSEVAAMLNTPLGPTLERWVEWYQEVGDRDKFLWKWVFHAEEITTLSCVPPHWRQQVCETKFLGVMFDVLLDDVADGHGDDEFLEVLLELAFGLARQDFAKFSPQQRRYARFAAKVWGEIRRRARRFPCFAEYSALLRYDYRQLFNALRYAHLLNQKPELLNPTEHDLVLPHNMHMMVQATLDLMCSPQFDRLELARLREAIWRAQSMGRIGNLITTWQRELRTRDFTSGVFARALAQRDLTPQMLRWADCETIEAAVRRGGHEAHFFNQWQEHRRWLLRKAPELRSVDLGKLVAGLDRLIRLHLGSRGQK